MVPCIQRSKTMDLKFNPDLVKKKIDPENGNILFYRKDMKGVPDFALLNAPDVT